MYTILRTNQFKKSFKRCVERGLNIKAFEDVINQLIAEGKVSAKHRPHKLNSRFNRAWECHIEPDWLLVWEKKEDTLTLILLDTGTHSDIFGK